MFGKLSSRKQKQLQESGTRAPATVLSVAEKGMAVTHGAEGVIGNTELDLKTTFRVEPVGQPAFEVTRRMRYGQLSVPVAGQRVNVIFDPDDHDTLMLDDNALPPSVAAALGTAAQQVAGQPTSPMGMADLPGLLANIKSAQAEAGGDRQKLAELLQQQFGTGATVIDGQTDVVMPEGFTWPPAPGGAAAAPDPETERIDQLERLAKLHAAGALTDAEFAEQKARVLGT